MLLSENGAAQTVQSVETKAEELTAYNLTVADFHTYFVKGTGSGTDAVWVHNTCPIEPPQGAYPTGKTTPDGKPIYKDYDPKTNSWKDIYPDNGKWSDYDPNNYKPNVPEQVKWNDNGSKHVPNRNLSWKEIVDGTKGDKKPAKYHPDINIEKIERDVWENGIEIKTNDGTRAKIKDMGHVVGASKGVETQYVIVKYSAGEIHGQPITHQEYRNRNANRLSK